MKNNYKQNENFLILKNEEKKKIHLDPDENKKNRNKNLDLNSNTFNDIDKCMELLAKLMLCKKK